MQYNTGSQKESSMGNFPHFRMTRKCIDCHRYILLDLFHIENLMYNIQFHLHWHHKGLKCSNQNLMEILLDSCYYHTLFLSCNGFVYHNLLHLHHTEILVYNIGHVHFPRHTVKTCSNLDHLVNQVKPDNYLRRI